LNECGKVKVNKQVLVAFTIGRNSDEVLCDYPMHAGHILLGRPWQYERRVIHDGFRNMYKFVKDGKTSLWGPTEAEKWDREVPENKEKRVEPRAKKERELAERKGKEKMSFYAKESEVKRAFLAD